MFGIFVHYSTRPIYDVSMNLFCRPPSVDIFNISPGFLWQPLLIELFLEEAIGNFYKKFLSKSLFGNIADFEDFGND